jgi:hypothetical protein
MHFKPMDFFEGGEQPVNLQESDLNLKRDQDGHWRILETSKFILMKRICSV